jgi:hypothetical protein
MTAVDLDELAMRSDETCPLIRGQYSIIPDGGKKAELYSRVTNFIKPLADTYRLELWERRMVALGLVANPGLFALVAAAHPDDKNALDDYCAKAKVAAKGGDRADLGTALHTMTERVDRGEDPDTFPEPFRSDLRAYRATMDAAGIEILEIERYIVLPDLKVAGRTDRIVSFGSQPKIADVKTGSLDFGMGEIAAQLACYANGKTFYDPKIQTHTPMPDVDKDTGIVIHLPAGKGICTLHFVDIKAGWEAVQHADWIRKWRRRRDLSDPWRPGTQLDSLIERRAGIVTRLETLKNLVPDGYAAMARNWPHPIPTFKQSQDHTPEQLNAIDTVLSAIEDQYQAPFGPIDANHNATLKEHT